MASEKLVANRYELRALLGQGGMGQVFLAYDRVLATEVALKRIPLEHALDEHARQALISEARLLARLSHTHIVRIFDLLDTPEGLYLVLEYVCGPSLDHVLHFRPQLSLEELRHLFDQIGQALTRAHAQGIIHRDLKPSNLLLALSGDDQRRFLRERILPPSLLSVEVKVADFGLAKLVAGSRVEASGLVSGTPAFMAPEQFRGELPSVETDVYSLGLIAYQCLAGRLPLGDAQPIYFHLFVTPPPIPGLPAALDAVIQRAIRKERSERYATVAAFVGALAAPPAPEPPKIAPEPPKIAPEPPKVAPEPPKKVAPEPPAPPPGFTAPPPAPAPRPNRTRIYALIAFGFLTVLSVGVVLGVRALFRMAGGEPTVKPAYSTTPSPAAGLPEPGLLPPLNPAPRIDALPPVIDSARLPASGSLPAPPPVAEPVILARLRVTGYTIFGYGPDGTLYLTSNRSDIGAVRDGRLLWQYKLGSDDGRFAIMPDGLIWVRSRERSFVFNSAGQGGELTGPALAAAPDLSSPPQLLRCLSPGPQLRDPVLEQMLPNGRPLWRTPLDQPCAGEPQVTPEGNILVRTASRQVYLVSSAGRVLWTFPAPCEIWRPLLLPNHAVAGLCSDRDRLIAFAEGRQLYSRKGDHPLGDPFAFDRESAIYRVEEADVYDRKLLRRTRIDGGDDWTVELPVTLTPTAGLGPDGRIAVLHGSPEGAVLYLLGPER